MKFRLVLTVTHEFEVHPENYPDDDPESMLKLDIHAYENDLGLFLEFADDATVTGEIIP